jgi:hypothetical protein
MCGNNLGKNLILFSITLALGVLSVNFFVFDQLPGRDSQRRKAGQKPVSDGIKIKRAAVRDCFPVEPDSEKSFKSEILNEQLAALIEQKKEIKNRLREYPRASEKEKTLLRQRLDVIEKQILRLKDSDRYFEDENNANQKLLYLEECYEF